MKNKKAKKGIEREPHRSLFYAMGYTDEELSRPLVGEKRKKNVILACNAKGPSSMSDYAKTVCEQSRISLDRNELADQRKRISIKNDMLIKLVIQDIYEAW